MDYPQKKGTPSFKEKNDIAPVGKGKTKNTAMDKKLFNSEALSGEITTSASYAKKGKGGTVNKSVVSSKTNSIWPDSK